MAEMLIAVAIVLVLAAVAFIGVQYYLRAMHQLEYDGYAKELFIAAQNHLTMADSQGLVKRQTDKIGTSVSYSKDAEGAESRSNVYCLVIPAGESEMLNLMLPSMSITTGQSGSFMIVYQKSSATILEVFYSPREGIRYGHDYTTNEYEEMMGLRGENHKLDRRNHDGDGAILGYYGGGDGVETVTFKKPELEVINAEKLKVLVTNPNTESNILKNVTMDLVVTGKISKAQKTIRLLDKGAKPGDQAAAIYDSFVEGVPEYDDGKQVFTLVFDDITSATGHFAKKFETVDSGTNKYFIPGEDLEIRASIYSSSAYSKIEYADATTNSLFADPVGYTEGKAILGSTVEKGIAGVKNFRHLENLDARISQLDKNDKENEMNINQAAQIKSSDTDDPNYGLMDWNIFLSKFNSPVIITLEEEESSDYIPVNPSHWNGDAENAIALSYNGQANNILNVKVNYPGDAGLFGELITDSSVSNLKLIDFGVTGTTNAGALAGTATGTTVTNVITYHTEKEDAYKTATVTASSGSAGGLIGSMSGGTVEKCGAALVVSGSANAGGLIGVTDSCSINASFSGGHTISGKPTVAETKYIDDPNHAGIYPVRYDSTYYNVVGGTTAGGLIGSAGKTDISNSYSTCSATANTAGGFIGTGNGKVGNCYCTGLVFGKSKEGAFTGAESIASFPDTYNYFFEIINERKNTENGGYDYLKALGNKTDGGIVKIDGSAQSYETFVGKWDDWEDSYPYNQTLNDYYGNGKATGTTKYTLKSAAQLDTGVKTSDFVATHYGDWPAPEEFVFN